ncbi:hypothetical protein LIER_22353 [Lithospermum erythrorhizon]|uniref:Reverse transcriptase zinc-binding domain-containing protein n=1 Tax=Lithospermum erythrorhizon TaxID=34254 RepID=A0AAV3QWM7_LITER
MVLNCVNEGRFLKKFNLTLITLISKVPNPVEIMHFRPIALCFATPQRNFTQKSTVTFSPNVCRDTRVAISRLLGTQEVTAHGTYLGLPSTIGSSKKERGLTNSLPTIDNLRTRQIDIDPTCLLCSVTHDIVVHIFNTCSKVKEFCKELNIEDEVVGALSFQDLFAARRTHISAEQFLMGIMHVRSMAPAESQTQR